MSFTWNQVLYYIPARTSRWTFKCLSNRNGNSNGKAKSNVKNNYILLTSLRTGLMPVALSFGLPQPLASTSLGVIYIKLIDALFFSFWFVTNPLCPFFIFCLILQKLGSTSSPARLSPASLCVGRQTGCGLDSRPRSSQKKTGVFDCCERLSCWLPPLLIMALGHGRIGVPD